MFSGGSLTGRTPLDNCRKRCRKAGLAGAGCLRIFADKLSGKNADRPELAACLDYLRPGDTLVVPSLDRLSRSLADLIQIVGTLRRQGVGFKSLHEALDTTTACYPILTRLNAIALSLATAVLPTPSVPMARADCPLTSASVRFYADREAAGGAPSRGDHAHP
jgi:hypothetical protein